MIRIREMERVRNTLITQTLTRNTVSNLYLYNTRNDNKIHIDRNNTSVYDNGLNSYNVYDRPAAKSKKKTSCVIC